MGRIFGTDGVRGVACSELSVELAVQIGRAAGMVVSDRVHQRKPRFLIGWDTRISWGLLSSAITAGLCSVGVDVELLGVVPTPAVAYLVRQGGFDAGVMLSASHNPYEYNGIKLFGPTGFKLSDREEEEIESIILDHSRPVMLKTGGEIGSILPAGSQTEDYIRHICDAAPAGLEGLRLLIDCANGSASATAREIFTRLGAQVELIGDRPNGININDRCGSTHIQGLQQWVAAGRYDMGVAFDGDADRCLAVDAEGRLVDGDQIIAILARDLMERGKLKNSTAVVTVMSNLGFFRFAKGAGIQTAVTKVGDRYVLEEMLRGGYNLGGEQSGHIIFLDHMTTGDGQLSAVLLADVLRRSGKPLSELAAVMTVYPQVLLNVRVSAQGKERLEAEEAVWQLVREKEAQMGERGRILVRPSGTEPLVRVMVEGEAEEEIRAAAQEIARKIEECLA